MRGRMAAAALAAALGVTAATAEPQATVWHATAAGDLALADTDGVTLVFAEGRIAGHSGCNRFTGAASLTAETPEAGRLELGPLAATRMACDADRMAIEAAVLAALGRIDRYRIEADGTLVLAGPDGPVLAAVRR